VNVTCEKCQRRYAVPDEKVRDRVLRIRCRNCQHPIEVSLPPELPPPSASAAANPWDEEPTRAAPRLDKSAHWFAMRGGHQDGPLAFAELETRVRAGEITLATFLWRDGLPEWRRADQLPELLPVFAAPKAARPQAAASHAGASHGGGLKDSAPAPEPASRPALQGLFDDDERTVLRPNVRPSRSAAPAVDPDAEPAPRRAGAPGPSLRAAAPEEEEEPPRAFGGRWLLLLLALLALAAVAAVFLLGASPL
jgi:predicted Zn finger-like uncharacterized protein